MYKYTTLIASSFIETRKKRKQSSYSRSRVINFAASFGIVLMNIQYHYVINKKLLFSKIITSWHFVNWFFEDNFNNIYLMFWKYFSSVSNSSTLGKAVWNKCSCLLMPVIFGLFKQHRKGKPQEYESFTVICKILSFTYPFFTTIRFCVSQALTVWSNYIVFVWNLN